MPFVNLNKITVTGTYLMFDESVASGTVTFTPDVNLRDVRDPAGNQIDIPIAFQTTLNNSGQISVVLPASNDPDVFPTAFTYRVSENIRGSSFQPPYEYDIIVPFDSAGGTLDLADVAPVTVLPNVSGYALQSDFDALNARVLVLEALGGGGGGAIDGGTP